MPRHMLLTGTPGCGKTTVVVSVVRLLRQTGISIFGFWTEEIQRAGERQGFAVELVNGERGVLASVERPGPPRVGRYGVDVEAVDSLVTPEIRRGLSAAESGSRVVIVMDEIGKMELLSGLFRQAALAAFDSPARCLATILARPHPYADPLRSRPDVEVVTVTRQNRQGLPRWIAERLVEG